LCFYFFSLCYNYNDWEDYCYLNDQSKQSLKKKKKLFAAYSCLCRAELDKRRAEKLRLEEERKKENLDKFRKDREGAEKAAVLSTGLKDKGVGSKTTMMDEEGGEIEEEADNDDGDDDDHGGFSEDEDFIDEDEDEEVSKFSF
jgi:hypothetical protein